MTIQEVCEKLYLSESTLIYAFKRTQENLAKQGIILTKIGRGKRARYYIKYKEDNNGKV